MRRPRVDFYHLFDDDEFFLKPIILVVKRLRFKIGISTVLIHKVGVATVARNKIGIATVSRFKVQG